MHYVLSSLVPYTEANIKLAFKPNWFFDDLEKLDRVKANKKALKTTYYRAIKNGLIEFGEPGLPRLTKNGELKLSLYEPKKLKNASLMLIFDIPEAEKSKRQHLRIILRQLKFRQIQKSVYVSNYDSRKYLKSELKKYHMEKYVKLFESHPI